MSIAYRVQDYIANRHLNCDAVPHWPSGSSMETARLAHIPPDRLAKGVMLEDSGGYVLAVIPANRRLDLGELREALEREVRLVSERELPDLFADCTRGAVPVAGAAYGVRTMWDASLGDKPDVYFEGGDHRTLVHMSGTDFCELMRGARTLPPAVH